MLPHLQVGKLRVREAGWGCPVPSEPTAARHSPMPHGASGAGAGESTWNTIPREGRASPQHRSLTHEPGTLPDRPPPSRTVPLHSTFQPSGSNNCLIMRIN